MCKILVVDDEPFILSSIERALSNRAEVKTVGTATEALEEVSSCHYALCLLDYLLPDMNGLEVMSEINKISPETKVAIMTGSHLDDTMKQTIEESAYHFISKPFSLQQIKDVAQKVIEDTRKRSKTITEQ
ncbi:MAG: response regulator [Nitrospirota bacterium]|jgi:DNA-binding NtrC family response regulator